MCGQGAHGGYLTLAATLCTTAVAEVISAGEGGGIMHGPTFWGTRWLCAWRVAAVELLLSRDWRAEVGALNTGLGRGLATAWDVPAWWTCGSSGGIGVIELAEPVDMPTVTAAAVARASGCVRSGI